MPINRAANNHNVAGIRQGKECDVSPMLMFLQCDVKLCQQVKSRGKRANVLHKSISIEVKGSHQSKKVTKTNMQGLKQEF